LNRAARRTIAYRWRQAVWLVMLLRHSAVILPSRIPCRFHHLPYIPGRSARHIHHKQQDHQGRFRCRRCGSFASARVWVPKPQSTGARQPELPFGIPPSTALRSPGTTQLGPGGRCIRCCSTERHRRLPAVRPALLVAPCGLIRALRLCWRAGCVWQVGA